MIKNIVRTLGGIVAGTLLLAWLISLAFGAEGLGGYVDILFGCSAAVLVLGGAMMNGGGRGHAHDELMRAHPELARFEGEDQERGHSIGLVTAYGGILSGLIGYGLHLLL